MVREDYELLKVALTKELGKNAKLLYKIKMENLRQQTTVHGTIASANRAPMKSQNIDAPYKNLDPELRNPLYSWYQNLKIESQLNANYSFDNFLEGDANRLAVQQVWLSPTNQVELHSTHY
jgi:chromosomal replication initiator protein